MVKNSPASAGDMGLITCVRKIPRSRKWQPTPVFLPGKSNGQRNQVDYSLESQRVGHDLATRQQQTYKVKMGISTRIISWPHH